MTVESTINSVVRQCNGAATVFSFPFYVLSADHLVVQKKLAATGDILATLTPAEYTISGIGDEEGGSVTIPAASGYSSDYEILIQRLVPYDQLLDLVNQSGFYPDTVEQAFDKAVMGLQQLADIGSRSLRLAPGETLGELPGLGTMQGKFITFGPEGVEIL